MSGAVISMSLAVAFLGAVFVATWLAIAEPWKAQGGSLADHWRIGSALFRFDFWLEAACVGRRRRRELRNDLRANLWDATARHGSREAVDSLGPLRTLARESAPPRGGGPRWTLGYLAAMVVGAAEIVAGFGAGTIWADAAIESGAAQVDGSPTLMPWLDLTYSSLPDGGFELSTGFNVLVLVAPLVAFVALARVWRLRSDSTQQSTSVG
ncbi:MAG: hypothetical protein S0880_09845 [Actinomycetota bacterium]|nr:hypothetical protein [Actinomycetota bacterium]